MCRIETVTCKAIKLPYDNDVKAHTVTVFDHLLKLRTVISFGRHGTINVCTYDLNIVVGSILVTFSKLTFDTFFSLIFGRISSVYDGFH